MSPERTRRSVALAAALGAHLVALVVGSFVLSPPRVSPMSETVVEVSRSDELASAPSAALPAPSSVSAKPPASVAASRIASGRLQEVAATATVAASRETPGDTALPGSYDATGALHDERSTAAPSS